MDPTTASLSAPVPPKTCILARDAGYGRVAVISAIGTREYYARYHGFELDGLYMTAPLQPGGP